MATQEPPSAAGGRPPPAGDGGPLAAKRRRCGEPRAEEAQAAPEDPANAGGEGEVEGGARRVKRKLALVFGYVGFRYRGLVINYQVEASAKLPSVEYVIREAMLRARALTPLNAEALEKKVDWSRSSRTDAGVSAVRLIVSGRFLVQVDSIDDAGHCPSLVTELNHELPDDVRCFGAARVPRCFNAKRSCSWREYEYLLPLEMAQPAGDKRAPEELADALQSVLRSFLGCHSFHNFSRVKASDLTRRPSAGPAAGREEAESEEEVTEAGVGADGAGAKTDTRRRGGWRGGKGGRKGNRQGGRPGLPADLAEAHGGSELAEGEGEEGLASGASEDAEPPEEAAVGALAGSSTTHAPVADAQAAPAQEPRWHEICAKDPATGAWRERNPEVLKHTATTMWLLTAAPALGGACLRVRLRGQFFIYNQIRLMVGSAAAVCRGLLPQELLEVALRVPVEMHMPMAPPTGLFLRTSGFTMLDQRAGFAAMDDEQARLCMMPQRGFKLLSATGSQEAEAFNARVEEEVARLWREGGEAELWLLKLREVRVPPEELRWELRRLSEEAVGREEAEFRCLKARLQALPGAAEALPRRFPTDLMVRFGLIPGWRVNHVQRALSARLRRWVRAPEERPRGLSSPPSTEELLDYIATPGLLDALAAEGAEGAR